jgi:hypothetical protein
MHMNDQAACVLVYGQDPVLLETRSKVIRTAGFRTCEAHSSSELAERLKPACCKAMVLCHSLTEQEAGRAALLAKEEIPGIKIIALDQSSAVHDGGLNGFVRPEYLIAVLKRAVLP